MKKSVMLLFLVCCNICFSQIGKLYSKNSKLIIGKENAYVYEPPKGIEIPKGAKVRVMYNNNFDYTGCGASLIKKANGYEFIIKIPDSTKYFVAAIIDGEKMVDNNNTKGYDVFLPSNSADMGKCLAGKFELIKYANKSLYTKLGLKLDASPTSLLPEYDNLFAKYPNMKEDKSYVDYLFMKMPVDKAKLKPEILEFAQKCEKKNSEEYMMIAAGIYGNFEMNDERKQVLNQIKAKFPQGRTECSNFFFDFVNHPDKTEAYILERLKLFTSSFNNIPSMYKDYFYTCLLKMYLDNRDLQKLDQYEGLLSDKINAANTYNGYAWNLSGQDLVTPAKDVDFAEKVSKRSLDIVADLQKQSEFPGDYKESYYTYADTYALILYKLNRFEEAFQIQDMINTKRGLRIDGKERYAGFMEKAKGLDVTKQYIEDQLSKGVNSRVLLDQLESIYTKLNLPQDNFKAIKSKFIDAVNANAKENIVRFYGGTNAINFSLKNLEGKIVSLSDLKGKVVVLDFWATWCGPCQASFPAMQELVTKYKDKDVEFLFVDTWEKGKVEETKEKVTKFISDKKYNFNVVFDYDNEVSKKYKVIVIPYRILIDKKGNIVSFEASENDLIMLIDGQLRM